MVSMVSNRVFLVIGAIMFSLLTAATAGAAQPEAMDKLQPLSSWTNTLAEAKRRSVPIVILFEQRNCGFCQRLKKELFRPTANDPAYSQRAMFVSVLTDFDAELLEQNHSQVPGFEFAQQFDALTTPTVVFVDSNGNEIEKRVVGYVSSAEYAQSFRQRLEASVAAVKSDVN